MSRSSWSREAGAGLNGVAAGSPAHLAPLMTLFSASFPTGGFAYSHGLEAAVREGYVTSAEAVRNWIDFLLRQGSGWNDLVFAAGAHRAVTEAASPDLRELCELATALSGSSERRGETIRLGEAFVAAASPWIGGSPFDGISMPLPVAAGAVTARAGLALNETLVAYAHNFAGSLLSAAVRLVPLGQSEWVGVMHDLLPVIEKSARNAARSTLDDLGSAAIVSEIAAMRHETLGTRLFRS